MSRQTIAVSVKASKLTARALAYVVAAVGRKIAKEHRKAQTPHGKQSVRKLMGHGGDTNAIEVDERDKKRAKQAVQHIGIYFSYIGKFENELTQLAEPTEEEIRQMREKIEEAQKEKSRAYHRNYSKEYRAKNLEKRREYERIKAREYRAKRKRTKRGQAAYRLTRGRRFR